MSLIEPLEKAVAHLCTTNELCQCPSPQGAWPLSRPVFHSMRTDYTAQGNDFLADSGVTKSAKVPTVFLFVPRRLKYFNVRLAEWNF